MKTIHYNTNFRMLIILTLVLLIIAPAYSQSSSIVPAEDVEVAKKLMEDNGIPLSVLNVGKFKTEIVDVLYQSQPPLTTVTLRHSYNGIPIDKQILYFWGDINDRVNGIFDNNLIYFFPKELENYFQEKGINRSTAFIDFSGLPTAPTIEKQEAEKIVNQIIEPYNLEPQHLKIIQDEYKLELAYIMPDLRWAENKNSPEIKLAWAFAKNGWHPDTVIDAKSGDLLWNFFDPAILFPESAQNYNAQKEISDIKLASSLLESNGIPLSLFSVGDFKTEITRVMSDKRGSGTSATIRISYSYKGIPILREDVLSFFNGKITHFYDKVEDDDPLRGEPFQILLLYPKENAEALINKGINKSVAFIDFSSLPTNPSISKEQAEITAKSIINSTWPDFAQRNYTIELSYYNRFPDKPKELTLVWNIHSTKNSAIVIVDAVNGNVLYDFNGVYYASGNRNLQQSNKSYFFWSSIAISIFVVIAVVAIIRRKINQK